MPIFAATYGKYFRITNEECYGGEFENRSDYLINNVVFKIRKLAGYSLVVCNKCNTLHQFFPCPFDPVILQC